MKRVLVVGIAVVAQLVISQAANAETVSFDDPTTHWAGWDSSAYQDSKDVLGKPQITGGTYEVSNGMLSSFSISNDPSWENGIGWGTFKAGDLFINVKSSADDHIWDYIVRTFNKSAAGDYALYDISSLNASDQRFLYGPNTNSGPGFGQIGPYITAYERHNQPVAIADEFLKDLPSLGTVFFSGMTNDPFNTSYTFNTPLLVGDSWSYSWTLTCGNDVVQSPVPEPASIVLLGAGLLGLAGYGIRRKNRKA